jgi:adenine-specific DNA-methyltransferase
LIVANPPYAKFVDNGKRASKNHNLINDFLQTSLKMLKPNGYLLFITPDNWMSYADRNILIEVITQLQIIHLDIHNAKKYFKKISSSFTWYIIENCPSYKDDIMLYAWDWQQVGCQEEKKRTSNKLVTRGEATSWSLLLVDKGL